MIGGAARSMRMETVGERNARLEAAKAGYRDAASEYRDAAARAARKASGAAGAVPPPVAGPGGSVGLASSSELEEARREVARLREMLAEAEVSCDGKVALLEENGRLKVEVEDLRGRLVEAMHAANARPLTVTGTPGVDGVPCPDTRFGEIERRVSELEDGLAEVKGSVCPDPTPENPLGFRIDMLVDALQRRVDTIEETHGSARLVELERRVTELDEAVRRAAKSERARESERREAAKARDAERRMVEEAVAKCGDSASKVAGLYGNAAPLVRVERLEVEHAALAKVVERLAERVGEAENVLRCPGATPDDPLCSNIGWEVRENARRHYALAKVVERLAELAGRGERVWSGKVETEQEVGGTGSEKVESGKAG